MVLFKTYRFAAEDERPAAKDVTIDSLESTGLVACVLGGFLTPS